jgi:biopolymer transport protein ExbD
MKKRVRRESLQEDRDIDMTPMIDCVFLLLIFFMVTTVFLENLGLIVDLPAGGANQNEEEQQQKKDVNVIVSANGDYTVNGELVSASALGGALKSAMDDSNNRSVIINGDSETDARYIVYAMDQAKGQGAEQFAFSSEQKESE